MKIKLFAHDDYDAIGCNVLARLLFENVEVEYHNYNTINKRLAYFLSKKEYREYDFVYITDISVNDNVAKLIQNHVQNNHMELKLIDHHESALGLNQYDWAFVSEYVGTQKTCATLSFKNYFMTFGTASQKELLSKQVVCDLVESVRLYDSNEWREADFRTLEKYYPQQLNNLMYLMGKKRFVENLLAKIEGGSLSLSETELMMLSMDAEKFETYLRSRNKALMVKDIQGYHAGIVFAENYVNDLSTRLMEMHPEIDFIAIIYVPFKVSFRTNKPNVNVLDIAKKYGGGGHIQSAGSNLTEQTMNDFVNEIFAS